MRLLAHPAMAVERLDGRLGDAVAYLAFSIVTSIAPGWLAAEKHGVSAMPLDIVVIQPLVALIAGILILLVPRLLNYVVAIYLIVIGIIGLWPRLLYTVPH